MSAIKAGANGKSSLPITHHRLFPAMVALWFAALFSLGSLAIRPALLESAVLALRLDLIVPSAAPPLGMKARALFALALFIVGLMSGLFVGRGLGRGGRKADAPFSRAQRAVFRAPPEEEITENEDLERLSAAQAMPGRRRALAMDEDFASPQASDVPAPGQIAAHEPAILDLSALTTVTGLVVEETKGSVTVDDVRPSRFNLPEPCVEDEQVPAASAPEQPAGLGLIPRDAAAKLLQSPVESLGVVELAERLALAIARRRRVAAVELAEPSGVPLAVPQPPPLTPPVTQDIVAHESFPEPEMPQSDAAQAVELDVLSQGLEVRPAMPSAMRPIDLSPVESDEDVFPASQLLPLRRFATPLEAASAQPAVPPANEAEPAYGSLLEMKPSAREAFPRIAEPVLEDASVEPVVIFPGHGGSAASFTPPDASSLANVPAALPARRFDGPHSPPPVAQSIGDAEETERALKAALATLQRMSGAA